MSQEAKWWPDPFGRFEQRYFDGSKWTVHVISNGEQIVDPLGTTPSVPFAAPASTTSADSAATSSIPTSGGASLREFLDGLGSGARTRSSVHLSIAFAGVGGLVAAGGIGTAILGDSDTSRARSLIAAIIVVAIAYAVRFGVKSQTEMRAAAVGAAAIGIPGLAVAITNTSKGGGTAVLAAVLLVAAWALPGMRGRPLLLGEGAVAVVLALSTFDSNTTSGDGVFDIGPANVIGGYSWLFVIAAVALLAMVWWLDAQGYQGVGTSLIVAAVLATAFAVLKVIETLDSTGAALLLALTGFAVAVVGDHGRRRATTWFGVAVAAVGTVAVIASSLDPNSTGDIATTLILAGLALVVVPLAVRAAREKRKASASDGSGVQT